MFVVVHELVILSKFVVVCMYIWHLCTYYGVVCMQWVNSCNRPVFAYLPCAVRSVEFAQSCADLWAVQWIGSSLGWPSLKFYWNRQFAISYCVYHFLLSVYSTSCRSDRVSNCPFCAISCQSSTYGNQTIYFRAKSTANAELVCLVCGPQVLL